MQRAQSGLVRNPSLALTCKVRLMHQWHHPWPASSSRSFLWLFSSGRRGHKSFVSFASGRGEQSCACVHLANHCPPPETFPPSLHHTTTTTPSPQLRPNRRVFSFVRVCVCRTIVIPFTGPSSLRAICSFVSISKQPRSFPSARPWHPLTTASHSRYQTQTRLYIRLGAPEASAGIESSPAVSQETLCSLPGPDRRQSLNVPIKL